jgi:SAM-dependent methyltransferase
MKIPTLELRSPTRISLDRILIPELKKLQGSVLDVGAGEDTPYKKYINTANNGLTHHYVTLDIDLITKADIICPVENMNVPDNTFDNVIATEVLEHTCDPQKAVDEIYRVLVPGGKCVLTTRFMYPYHPNPHDYYRFSKEAHASMFRWFNHVEIIPQGNRFMLLWEMINPNIYTRVFLNIFNWFIGLFDFKDDKFAMGYMIIAIK